MVQQLRENWLTTSIIGLILLLSAGFYAELRSNQRDIADIHIRMADTASKTGVQTLLSQQATAYDKRVEDARREYETSRLALQTDLGKRLERLEDKVDMLITKTVGKTNTSSQSSIY